MLNHRVSGTGDPVVFLHGFMEDLTMWDTLLPTLKHKMIVAIDLHGHGASPFDTTLYPSVEEMGKQVMDVITTLGLGHYQLVGHSMGGYVGCYLLENDPRLEHLILFHSHPWADSPAKKTDRERVSELVKTKAAFFIREAIPNLFAHAEQHQAAIERYCAMADRMQPEAISWATLAMRNRPSSEGLLKQFPDRVSIIQGQLDPLIPNLELKRFAQEARVGFYEIPDCGHMGQEEQPDAVRELFLALLG